ncbi:type IIL restriction-modification enzyme MmeI, partial [Planctomycetota bacterium]
GKPYRLKANEGISFQGSNVLGLGFTMAPEEARALISKDPRNRDVLFPYLIGKDLNSRPDQSSSRWIINFRNWPLDRESAPPHYDGHVAADYPDCLAIVREKVKPQRDRLGLKKDASARGYAKRWWQHGRQAKELYAAIDGMERVLVTARVSRTSAFARVPCGWVYDAQVVAFVLCDVASFGVLQCCIHTCWAQKHASSMRTDLRYTPSDVFETFPMPAGLESVRDAAQAFEDQRSRLCRSTGKGLTKIVNQVNDVRVSEAPVVVLRDLLCTLNESVREAYGWDDLELDHGFHKTDQGVRFTVGPKARREILDRLLALNHQRYAVEVAAGLHKPKGRSGKKVKKTRKTRKKALKAATKTLFDLDPGPPRKNGHEPTVKLLEALRQATQPLGKSELVEAAGIEPKQWSAAINKLKADGQVEQIGERRGAICSTWPSAFSLLIAGRSEKG